VRYKEHGKLDCNLDKNGLSLIQIIQDGLSIMESIFRKL
jgi:hypothetical protein